MTDVERASIVVEIFPRVLNCGDSLTIRLRMIQDVELESLEVERANIGGSVMVTGCNVYFRKLIGRAGADTVDDDD